VAVLQTDGEPGEEGEVRLLLSDGRLLGQWPFVLRAPYPKPHDLGKSWAEVSDDEVDAGDEVDVLVYPANVWGDNLGADASVALEVSGGEVTAEPVLWIDGLFNARVRASGESPVLHIDVRLNGDLLAGFDVAVAGTSAAEPAPDAPAPDPVAEPSPDDPGPDRPGPEPAGEGDVEAPRKKGGGCAGGGAPAAGPLGALLLAWAFRARRGRSRPRPGRPSRPSG
jgi:uncharacterized protein (TIGR03382 family)